MIDTRKASLPNPATAVRLYKTMYYSPKDPSPFNAPPPPDCKSCNKATSWKASRTKSNKFWLHEYSCSTSLGYCKYTQVHFRIMLQRFSLLG